MDIKAKNKIRLEALNYLGKFGEEIRTKFSNICGKTGQYDVPDEIFQKRTPRKNRVLLSWKDVKKNNLTIQQLETFEGGVVVELINEDLFEESNQNNPVFNELKNRIGSNEIVSAIISIRSESGSSSSQIQRDAFQQLINNTPINYNGNTIILNKTNYTDYIVKRLASGGTSNENWDGFLYVSIRGGQQDTVETHKGRNELLFNPACEYASSDVCCDIDLVMAYFALKSINPNNMYSDKNRLEFNMVVNDVEKVLANTYYKHTGFDGNLLSYCKSHPSLKIEEGRLYDPIQVEPIDITDFNVKDKEDSRNLDFTHDEAVNKGNYYWDEIHKCILSPARPTNIFWSKHLSNMMQQNFSLLEYFKHEEEIVQRRKQFLNT